MVNKQRLVRLTQQLIRIDSQNPPGDERKIARFVEGYFKRLGLKTKIYSFKPNRPNVIAFLEGKNKKHTLLLTPHLDTVPAGRQWKVNPFSGKIISGKIYGLGATDCKGNLACGMEAIHSLVEAGVKLNYNLLFAATADEETGSGLGLIPLLNKGILKPDAAVVLDSDEFNIIITQKGLIHAKVKIEGKRAHGAYPWRGINAIDLALKIIQQIKAQKFSYRANRYLRPPTINIGTIRGGDKVNVVADWCEFELDLRFLPGMSAQKILQGIKAITKKYAKKFKIETEGVQQPYNIAPEHHLVKKLTAAIRKAGATPTIKGSEGATVITFFQYKNIPAIATGFGKEACAHAANEYAQITTLYKGAKALENFLRSYDYGRG